MEITLDKQGASHGVATVKIAEADYQPDLKKQLKDYQRKANLKGFRPGKAPMGFIQRIVGKDMKADVVSRMVSDELNQYMQTNEVNILFSPIPKDEPLSLDDFATKKDFEFGFDLCLEPEFEYNISESFEATMYAVEPKAEEIDDVVEKIRKNSPKTVQAEEVAEGDFIKGTFKQVEGDFEKETVLPLNQVAEEQRSIFLDKKKDEAFTFDLRTALPEANTLKMLFSEGQEFDWDTLTGEFELTISEISREKEAELDEELFNKALGRDDVTSLEQFRDELKKIIVDGNSNIANDLFTREIRDRLVEETQIEFTEEIVKKIIKLSKEGITDEEVDKEFPKFIDALKWRVISNKIFKDADLKIEQEEIMEAAKKATRQSLAQMGLNNLPEEQMEQFVNMMLEREEFRQKSMEDGYEALFLEKITNHIKEQVTVTDKVVGVEEFKAIVDELVKQEQEAEAVEEAPVVEAEEEKEEA